MALAGDAKYINGNALSWGSFVFKVDGEELHGFDSVNYGEKRTRTFGYGSGASHAPSRRSRGKYEIDPVKVRGFKNSVQALRAAIARASGSSSYGGTEFEFLIQGVELDEAPLTIEFHRCVWIASTGTIEETAEIIKEEFEIQPMRILRNGLHLYDADET